MSVNQNILLAPSILSADFARLGESVERVLAAGADWIHVDVMDNHYVPNLTFGPMVVKSLRDYGITATMDVHLMVSPVDALIEQFASAGADIISFHPEATHHVDRSIELIKSHGCKAALALNPATPLSVLDCVIEKLDMILLMSVNPGFGGQSFIPGTLKKIRALHEIVQQLEAPIPIQVDGGVKAQNIKSIAEAGASIFVAGSAIFGQADYSQAIEGFHNALKE